MDYTRDLIRILTRLLPRGMDGGVSTSPLTYKPWMTDAGADAMQVMTLNIARIAAALVEARRRHGVFIHLDIEPEPDCLLETSAETVAFFEQWLLPVGGSALAAGLGLTLDEAQGALLEHVQVCFDCCHFAVEYEDPAAALERLQKAGIRIGRVQLSSALDVALPPAAADRAQVTDRLRPFADATYLHQVVERDEDGLRHYPGSRRRLARRRAERPAARRGGSISTCRCSPATTTGLGSTQGYVRAGHRDRRARPLHHAPRDRDLHVGRAPGIAEDRSARIDPARIRVGAGHLPQRPRPRTVAMHKTVVLSSSGSRRSCSARRRRS